LYAKVPSYSIEVTFDSVLKIIEQEINPQDTRKDEKFITKEGKEVVCTKTMTRMPKSVD
jgi:thioredoxin-related protein